MITKDQAAAIVAIDAFVLLDDKVRRVTGYTIVPQDPAYDNAEGTLIDVWTVDADNGRRPARMTLERLARIYFG